MNGHVPSKRGIAFYLIHFLICELIFVPALSLLLVYHSPFTKLRDFVVATSMETRHYRFLSTWFLSADEIKDILSRSGPVVNDGVENLSVVKVSGQNSSGSQGQKSKTAAVDAGVTAEDISGPDYKGKLITVEDPSRIKVGLAPGLGKSGTTLSNIIGHYGAIGGINAGGFTDEIGGIPAGIAIEDGRIKYVQSKTSYYSIIGFNSDNILVISNRMTADQVSKSNLRCAISFGPALILNGQPLVAKGGYTLQPRSAIAQRKDGAILLLAIDGRQSSSLGVNLKVLQDILLRHGAYNAANLDGGGSTTLALDGRILNNPSDITGERAISSAFLIMPALKKG